MPDNGNQLGQALRRLKKESGASYTKIFERFDERAAKISPYHAPPYKDSSSLSRILNGRRTPSRSNLLEILVWGLEIADVDEINSALTSAGYKVLTKKEIEDFVPDAATRPSCDDEKRQIQPSDVIQEDGGHVLYSSALRSEGGVWFDSNTKTLWHMAQSVFLPLSEEDLDMKTGMLGALRRIEIPRAALTEAMLDRPDLLMDRQVYEFLRDVWSHPKKYLPIIAERPALKTWIENIWAPRLRGSKGLERRQLQKFYRAMQSPDIPAELLPDFTYDEVSCWRVFIQAFPESLGLLEAASSITKMRHTQRMAVAALSSTLALTDDWRISSRAAAITRRLIRDVAASTVYSYREYQLVRHLLYAAVEAGESPADNFLDFVQNPHHPVKWELDLNRKYYKDHTDATMALTIVRKLERPLNRDEWTRKVTEYHSNLLPKKLIDAAYRKMRQPCFPVAPGR